MAGLEISKQFEQFSIFAADAMMHGNTKAIARTGAQLAGPDGPRKIEVTTDDKVYAFKRSQVNKDANDATRELFLKAVADTFNGEQNIPPSVLKALNMKDFKAGKPLTARRIAAVKAAIQDEDLRLRAADQMLADALPRNGFVLKTQPNVTLQPYQKFISSEEYEKAQKIVAKRANTLNSLARGTRNRIIGILMEMILKPEFAPHADELFNLIPLNPKELNHFTLDDLREMAPASLLAKTTTTTPKQVTDQPTP